MFLIRSQNDALRAEVEAQSAAHKAQINAAEARANDFWLSSKQSERRFEEARAEASALRRKLTTYATNNSVGAVENNINSRKLQLTQCYWSRYQSTGLNSNFIEHFYSKTKDPIILTV